MSEGFRIPRHAISFLSAAARLAAKHGLKKGLAKAAAGANPLLLALEAAGSVLEAVDLFIKLKQARTERDGLSEVTRQEAQALQVEREKLAEQIRLAEAELANHRNVQKRLGSLMLTCSCSLSHVWNELRAIRSADLPDIVAFDHRLDQLFITWQQLQRAQSYYYESGAGRQPGGSHGSEQDQAAGGHALGEH